MDIARDTFKDYESTHPWLRFQVDLTRAPAAMWIQLGEAASKCEHLAGAPLRRDTADQLHQIYMAKGILGTTAIEGNTLTEAQALEAVEGSLHVAPSQEYLAQEFNNIIAAVTGICDDLVHDRDISLARERINNYNEQVLRDLPPKENVVPGETRRHSVGVGDVYRGAPWYEVDLLLDKLCVWLNGDNFAAPSGLGLHFAILKAILAHLYIAWIHPYGDGNGRTARLVEFHILMASGVPTPAAHLLSNHYNQTRSEYYRQLDLASRSNGDVIPFICYALQGLVDGLRAQIETVRDQQFDLTWRDYVEGLFGHSPTDVRRTQLLVELGRAGVPVPKAKLQELSTPLAVMYAGKTDKTLARDLNSPIVQELVERVKDGYRARIEILAGFLPLRAAT